VLQKSLASTEKDINQGRNALTIMGGEHQTHDLSFLMLVDSFRYHAANAPIGGRHGSVGNVPMTIVKLSALAEVLFVCPHCVTTNRKIAFILVPLVAAAGHLPEVHSIQDC
jgi:hypothetical protein